MSWHHLVTAQRDLGNASGPLDTHTHMSWSVRGGGGDLKRAWWELARTGQSVPRGGSKNQEEKGRLIHIGKHLGRFQKSKVKRRSAAKMQTSQRLKDLRTGSPRVPSKCQGLTRVFSKRCREGDRPSAGSHQHELKAKESFFRQRLRKFVTVSLL